MKKRILGIALFAMLTATAMPQVILYTYDAAGNRTSRTLLVPPVKSGQTSALIADNTCLFQQQEQGSGISVKEAFNVNVFPNPFLDQLTVSIDQPAGCQMPKVVISDLTGRILLEKHVSAEKDVLNLGGFPGGVYILSVTSNFEKVSFRIIKE